MEVVGMKMRGWKCRDESEGVKNAGNENAGVKMQGWKCGDENAGMKKLEMKNLGMKMWEWKCGDENAGMKNLGMNYQGMKNLGVKKPGMKRRGWNCGDEVSLSLFSDICSFSCRSISLLLILWQSINSLNGQCQRIDWVTRCKVVNYNAVSLTYILFD